MADEKRDENVKKLQFNLTCSEIQWASISDDVLWACKTQHAHWDCVHAHVGMLVGFVCASILFRTVLYNWDLASVLCFWVCVYVNHSTTKHTVLSYYSGMCAPCSKNAFFSTMYCIYNQDWVISQQKMNLKNLKSLKMDFSSTVSKIAFVLMCVCWLVDGQRKWSGSSAA